MDIKFNSLEELYNRLKPALRTKVIEMHRNGYDYIETVSELERFIYL